jgi:hypothetical protein
MLAYQENIKIANEINSTCTYTYGWILQKEKLSPALAFPRSKFWNNRYQIYAVAPTVTYDSLLCRARRLNILKTSFNSWWTSMQQICTVWDSGFSRRWICVVVFWGLTPCSLVSGCQCFGGAQCPIISSALNTVTVGNHFVHQTTRCHTPNHYINQGSATFRHWWATFDSRLHMGAPACLPACLPT